MNETNRLYGVLNKQLAKHEYVAGEYSIADMACIGWAKLWERQGQDIAEFPHVKRWIDVLLSRPAVERGMAVAAEDRKSSPAQPEAAKVLFGQRARHG